MKYGRLTILGEKRTTSKTGKYRYFYDCLCDCGEYTSKDKSKVRGGITSSCGCLQNESRKSLGSRVAKPVGEAAFNNVYRSYMASALKRGYEFALTKKQFKEIVVKPCFYCGRQNSNKYHKDDSNGYFMYTGIDRYNNLNGYTIDNCVPCCSVCNRIKTDMPVDVLATHLQTMLDNKDIWQRTA